MTGPFGIPGCDRQASPQNMEMCPRRELRTPSDPTNRKLKGKPSSQPVGCQSVNRPMPRWRDEQRLLPRVPSKRSRMEQRVTY